MKKMFEMGIMIAATAGFFGIIYPELCLIEETCRIVEAETEEASPSASQDPAEHEKVTANTNHSEDRTADLFRTISDLPPDKIRIKSKLLEYLNKLT